jgi:competence protein ComEA
MGTGNDRILKSWTVALTVGVLICAVAASAGAMAAESSAAKVDINKATEKELMSIRGIGETLAKRIVAFRDEHGPFRRPEDLMKVRGIGEKSFEKIRPHITVEKTT